MSDLIMLPWLRKQQDDFAKLLREVVVEKDQDFNQLYHLTTYALNSTSLQLLDRKLQKFLSAHDSKCMTNVKVAILSNATTNYIASAIRATGLRHRLLIQTFEPEFDQIQQNVIDSNSDLYRYNPDIILLNIDWRALPLRRGYQSIVANQEELLESSKRYVQGILDNIKKHSNASVVLQTVPMPLGSVFGHFDSFSNISFNNLVYQFNQFLSSYSSTTGVYVLDIANLASMIGLSRWFDQNYWYFAKIPFSQEAVPLYADHVSRMIAAIKGTSRKVLVLDLDNTLWGGIIGDDGVEGIRLGLGDSVGEAHTDLQNVAKSLKERGVVLAISSKNTHDIAMNAFKNHPEMILQEDDITVFHINWVDKASNIESMAKSLNLGLDSFVFVDDNPAEREQVRQKLPQVAVLEMPKDPSSYATLVAQCGYFESVSFSNEDALRSQYYKNNLQRASAVEGSGSIEEYLESLKMVVTFAPFDAVNRPRIAQLINKSNQYNLTTRRYTENEVESLENNSDILTLQVRLEDCFGDNGMISVVICRKDYSNDHTWLIDSWLMSCRVLSRKVEHCVLNRLVQEARRKNITTIQGVYIPTTKNALVKDHYEKLGFSFIREDEHQSIWELDVKLFKEFNVPISVVIKDKAAA